MPLEELATQSNSIVYGEVTAVKSAWREQGNSRVIITEVTLSIERAIKLNPPSESITFFVLGGRVDDIVQRISGEPSFKPGEHVLVFLEERSPGEPPWVMGMAQGTFRILSIPNAPPLAVQDTSSLVLADIQSRWDPTTGQIRQNAEIKEAANPALIRPLPDLLSDIERLVSTPLTPTTP